MVYVSAARIRRLVMIARDRRAAFFGKQSSFIFEETKNEP